MDDALLQEVGRIKVEERVAQGPGITGGGATRVARTPAAVNRPDLPAVIRQRVRLTARDRCGYCLSPQRYVMSAWNFYSAFYVEPG